jgi:hypothetical protein
MPTTRTTLSTRRRGVAGLLAIAAALTLVATACDVPVKPAGTLFQAWKDHDTAKAHTVAGNTAVSQIFAKTYKAGDQWLFISCNGAAGSTYCTWVNIVETSLVMRVANAADKVAEVHFNSLASGKAGHFFHDWRVGDKSNAANYATSTAINQLFNRTYKASDHWVPTGCDGTAGSLYCVWANDNADTLTLHYPTADGAVHKVDSVVFEQHPDA